MTPINDKPTARSFFTGCVILWFVFVCIAAQLSGFSGVIMVNLIVVVINVLGTMISAASGWVPWRDRED